jgi:hypothetical protein
MKLLQTPYRCGLLLISPFSTTSSIILLAMPTNPPLVVDARTRTKPTQQAVEISPNFHAGLPM